MELGLGLGITRHRQNVFTFLNTVTPAQPAVNRYVSKPRICDFAITTGAEGKESYPVFT